MTVRREWIGVALIVLAATITAAIFVLQIVQYVIMPDELGYLKQGIQLSHGSIPTPGSLWFNSWALLRPLTIAPAYKLFATPTAFDVAHVSGALLMSTAAVPAYLLARRVTGSGVAGLLVAAQSVFIPWLAMSGSMMTEVVAYPAFLWAMLAMVNGIERPRLRNDVLLVAALGLAFVARTQLVVLAPLFAVAVLAVALVRRDAGRNAIGRVRAAARAHWALLAGAAVLLVAVAVTGSVKRFLGGYAEPSHGSLFPPGSGHATHELSAYVIVGIGVLPLAFTICWVVLSLARRDDDVAAAIVVAITTAALAVIGGAFTVRYTAGINDRYFFYAAPLLFTGMAAALLHAPRDVVWRAALAVGSALSVWLVWTSQLAQHGTTLISASQAFHDVLSARGADVGLSGPHLAAVVAAGILAAAIVAGPALRATTTLVILGGLVLAFGVGETIYTLNGLRQPNVSQAFLAGRNWVDRLAPAQQRVGILLGPTGDPSAEAATWWDTSFWNKSIDSVYEPAATPNYEQAFWRPVQIDPDTGRIPGLDRSPLLVRPGSDTRFGLHLSETLGSEGGLELIRAERPYRADWLFTGPDPQHATVPAGGAAKVRVYGSPGVRAVELTLGAPGDGSPSSFEVDGGASRVSGKVGPGARSRTLLRLALERGSDSSIGHADLEIRVRAGSVTLLSALAS